MKRTLFFVAGEHSGDQRAAALIRQLKVLDPSLAFAGLGGSLMAEAGCRLLFDLPSVAALGFTDVLRRYFTFRKIFYDALSSIEENEPSAIILVDFPGFNIRLAKKIRRRFPVIYYVSPQVWAWAPHRKHTIARSVSKMLTLFKFETETYKGTSLDVEWVGHPLVDQFMTRPDRRTVRKSLGLSEDKSLVGILPGSRENEICRILPVLLDAARLIKKTRPDTCFLISESPTINAEIFEDFRKRYQDLNLLSLREKNLEVLAASDFAMVCSGTATLEAMLSDIPFLVIYKTAYLTYLFARNLMHIPYIAMVNVLAHRMIVPEFIQHYAQAKPVACCVLKYLGNPEACQKMRHELQEAKKELGECGAAERTARAILKHLEN